MRSIAIDVTENLVYEGENNYGRGVLPTPSLYLATVLSATFDSSEIPESEFLGSSPLIFRDDSFDVITRVRRGRFYGRAGDSQPHQWHVRMHPGQVTGTIQPHYSETYPRMLHGFHAWPSRLRLSAGSIPSICAFGIRSGYTLWRVVDIERSITGEDVVTLRARTGLGLLPELLESAVPADALQKVSEVLETLTLSAHTSAPTSVIDRARDAAQWCIGVWWAALKSEPKLRTRDLGDLAKTVANEYSVVAALGQTIARLHARGKPNEQERYAVRPPIEADAEYALAAVGLLMREIGWAAW